MYWVVVRRISVILLVLLSLSFGTYRLLMSLNAWDSQAGVKNEVSIWENRFDALRRALPPDVRQVSYVAEWDLPGGQFSEMDQFNEFRLTRYTMAPVVVTQGFDQPWIIANFSSRKFETWLRSKIGDYQIQEFSGGIYLVHKVQP